MRTFTASRRGFLKTTLGSCWTGAALLEQSTFRAGLARAQATDALPVLFDIEKVADGIYQAIARPQAQINCNAAIFEGANDLLIVDTHSKPSAVTALVSQIRRELTKKPVRYIVNSHFHWDHSQGNAAYRQIAPHADIVSSEATRQLISELGAQRLRESVEQAEKSLDSRKQSFAEAKTPEQKSEAQRLLKETQTYVAEMKSVKPELPNVTFDRNLIIRDKAYDLHLAFRGRAHTAGDIVVFCPQRKVVATGDMLHGGLPFMGDGYPKEWTKTIDSVSELPFDKAIGGHGRIPQPRIHFPRIKGYIEELTMVVERDKRAGKTADQIQVSAASLKSMSGGLRDYMLTFMPPEALEAGIKTNAAHVFQRLGAG